MTRLRAVASLHQVELVAAAGIACLYLAVMSGHLMSIDGLVMWRQALAVTYHHSWSFVPTIWWGGNLSSSYRGVGASLEYVPSLLIFPWLSGHVPVQTAPQYDFRLLYDDVLYTVAGAPVWVVVTAGTAYLVGLSSRALGADRRISLWAIAFYGLGSPALAASRGDTPQSLVALSWAVGFWACLRFSQTGGRRWLWISAVSIFYGVLTRPLEGSMLLPAVLVLLSPGWRNSIWPLAGQVASWMSGVAATLLLNWARFGSPTNLGYGGSQLQWTTPIWVGLPGALVSPGRGILWEFPAIVLTALGTAYLWRHGKRSEALALAGLPTLLLIEASTYVDWVGGWDWGFRFFQPALPLVAILAGVGLLKLPVGFKGWLPPVLLAGGFIWNVPAVATDILGGYGLAYSGSAANWQLDAYPPVGAWRFLHHALSRNSLDSGAIDIVWFRAVRFVGWVSLIPFGILVAMAIWLWRLAVRWARTQAQIA